MKIKKTCPEIAITGGPCGGKSSGLAYLKQKLQDMGYRVFTIQEVATMIMPGISDIGIIAASDSEKFFTIEKEIIRLQMDLRRRYHALAALFPGEKMVILSDRGVMDALAYLLPKDRLRILKSLKLNLYDVRDSYDGVIHLMTAAIGAEEYYSTENNEARRETIEEAREVDQRTRDVWTGSEHFKVIDNSTDFHGKMKKTLQAITRVLGIPVPLEIERRFLVKSLPDFTAHNIHVQKVNIEQKYLISPNDGGSRIRIRKRSQWGFNTFYQTRKTGSGLVRQETSDTIDSYVYLKLGEFQESGTKTIIKDRTCFLYNNQYFEFDEIYQPKKMLVLELELTEENDVVDLPPFIKVIKEITGESGYSNYDISKVA